MRAILEPLDSRKKWKFLDSFANVDEPTFLRIKDYPECIEVYFKYTPDAQKLLSENAEIWMKYFEAKSLLKNKQYKDLEDLFDLQIEDSEIVNGIRYAVDGSPDLVALKDAIKIANRNDDVGIISKKLNISEKIIYVAKKHYYIDEHIIAIQDYFTKKSNT
ncbi:hypothetical protein [Algoriella sp.]|uniref:hypothetical protein n=1 Tax=Algoriella sp. TaxID=1872434 RepID=UPI002FC61417